MLSFSVPYCRLRKACGMAASIIISEGPQAAALKSTLRHGVVMFSSHPPCRPHITFISGANGSGKSAIMSALQVQNCYVAPAFLLCVPS